MMKRNKLSQVVNLNDPNLTVPKLNQKEKKGASQQFDNEPGPSQDSNLDYSEDQLICENQEDDQKVKFVIVRPVMKVMGGSCRGGVVMQGWGGLCSGGWVMQGWGGSCRGGVGHVEVW